MLKLSQALATMFLIPSIAVMSVPSTAQSAGDLPRIERRGNVSQLIVGGKPFLILGGELHNSSSSTLSYMQPIWPKLAAMNLNTVLVPVSWEQVEPREGSYDFSLVDGLIRDARRHNLRIGLLWFGTWKNLVSSYAPAWVRRDTQRFPTAIDKAGNKLPILSTFSKEGQAADARAFAALMKHLREVDAKDQTVIMVQVENEVGLGNAERDYSAAANQAFTEDVPRELIVELVRRKGDLSREMLGAWTAAGAKTSGTWEQVFGSSAATNEIFMAWHYARYISGVVAEGHSAYRLPLFVNAAIGRQDGRLATYPSGGPLPLVLNVWQAGAPQISMFTPDIYYGSFADWSAKYTQSGNPLFIPEMRGGAQGAANAFLAIGNYGAIGASPFGIDASLGDKDLTQAYSTLEELAPFILSSQPKNMVKAVALDATVPSGSLVLGDYTLNVQLRRDRRSSDTAPQGYALAIAEPGNRFIIAGKDVQVTFATRGGSRERSASMSSRKGPSSMANGSPRAGSMATRLCSTIIFPRLLRPSNMALDFASLAMRRRSCAQTSSRSDERAANTMTRLDLRDWQGRMGITRARRFLAVCALAFATTVLLPSTATAQQAVLFDGRRVANVVYDDVSSARLAAELLGRDLAHLTGAAPRISATLSDCGRLCVVVGGWDSALVRRIAADAGVDLSALGGQWERYVRVLVQSKRDPSQRYVLIAGSDPRGAVWGVIDLTRELGVSAWEWWADVKPQSVKRLAIDGAMHLSETPAVQYRGIFLNDEDWGLQPWAAKTFEPEAGDIGPKTYARIFELMWRLKANLVWPAMHESTKPFYQIPGNADMAKAYAIVVGTSHAEPMMRNNVREWDEQKRGEFNFFENRQALVDYWRERAEQVKGFENLYTIGLRGKHDSGMEGAKTPEAARDALTKVMEIQRDLLAKAQGRPAAEVPQALTLYKEVLDIYSTGLKVPEDVTLVWPEDNYGYINQLANPQERARSGGSGVYYHISYWGRPHDYLWLATTHPALIREQMDRAWQMEARKIWVVNVGDIKPGEYLTQYFLDLAFDRNAFAVAPREHLKAWAAIQFGARDADAIAEIMTVYYDLAFERRPEFMGFGQVEPIRPNQISDYVRTGGDEAERRLDRYAALVRQAEALAATISSDRQDAFFQLVLYPVRGAASLNERILKLDLAALHAKAIRAPAIPGVTSDEANGVGSATRADSNALSDEASAAQQRIVNDTAAYNALNGGKWNGIMNAAPRGLPVFQAPAFPRWDLSTRAECGIEAADLVFVAGRPATRSFTLYSSGASVDWSISRQRGGIASAVRGRLDPANGFRQRLALAYDGGSVLDAGNVQCGGRSLAIPARLARSGEDLPPEINRIISLAAASARSSDWEVVPGLGSRGGSLRARLDLASADQPNGPPLTYRFQTSRAEGAELRFIALPVHPLTSLNRLRVAVRLNGGPLQILDFETLGRSDEWKRNALSNSAIRTIALPRLRAGQHKLEIFALDPGFMLDRIDLRLDGAPDYYGAPPTSERRR